MADYVTQEQFDRFLVDEDEHHKRAEAEVARVAVDIAKIRKTLYGNGDPGWDEILRELLRDLKERQEAAKQLKAASEKRKEITWEEVRKYIFWFLTTIAVLFANAQLTAWLELMKK